MTTTSLTSPLVNTGHLTDKQFPICISPAMPDVDLSDWLASNAEETEQLLLDSGAALFRGFDIRGTESFREAVESMDRTRLTYADQHTPRSHLGEDIYTSTDYPPDHTIPFHSENSKNSTWPTFLWFNCTQPAAAGGNTPLADNRLVYEALDPKIVNRFEKDGVKYVRNFGEGLGVHWKTAFNAESRHDAEKTCHELGIDYVWLEGDRLQTSHVAQATLLDPRTGETVWFNQASLFSIWSLDTKVRSALTAMFGIDGVPSNSYYGDGETISQEVIESINDAFAASSSSFTWNTGDVLLVDNVKIAHSRDPFSGERRILVAMT